LSIAGALSGNSAPLLAMELQSVRKHPRQNSLGTNHRLTQGRPHVQKQPRVSNANSVKQNVTFNMLMMKKISS